MSVSDGLATATGGRGHHLRPLTWLLASLTLAASIAAACAIRWADDSRLRATFRARTQNVVNGLRESLSYREAAVRSLAGAIEISPKITREEFSILARKCCPDFLSIQALEWIPKVAHSQRPDFERAAREDGLTDFEFKQWSQGGWVADPEKWANEYMPVFFLEPRIGNEQAVGIDLASNPTRRRSLELARDTGRVVATEGITLAQEEGVQTGFLLCVPVYDTFKLVMTAPERRRSLRGFALGVFRVGDIVNSLFSTRDLDGVQLRITDADFRDEERALLYESPGFASQKDETWRTTYYHSVGGRNWKLDWTYSSEYVARQRSWGPWLALVAGTMLSSMVAWIMKVQMEKTALVEGLVDERTAALLKSEADLLQATDQLDQALENGNVGLWDWNTVTNEVYYSSTLKTQLGYPADAKLAGL